MIIIGICLIISIGLLIFFHYFSKNSEIKIQELRQEKHTLTNEREELIEKINQLAITKNELNTLITNLKEQCDSFSAHRNELLEQYNSLKTAKDNEFNSYIKEQELKNAIIINSETEQRDKTLIELRRQVEQYQQEVNDKIAQLEILTSLKQQQYQNLIEPLQTLELEKDKQRNKCIALTQNDIEDIHYLLNEVQPHIKNKDIIGKLVWSTYIQKPFSALLKAQEIEDVCGIYKITNIHNNKCYIGKSITVKTRLQNHVKGACGIDAIADQLIHREMIKEGLENWMFELIEVCNKDILGEREKYYISFFNSREYGYNIASGG